MPPALLSISGNSQRPSTSPGLIDRAGRYLIVKFRRGHISRQNSSALEAVDRIRALLGWVDALLPVNLISPEKHVALREMLANFRTDLFCFLYQESDVLFSYDAVMGNWVPMAYEIGLAAKYYEKRQRYIARECGRMGIDLGSFSLSKTGN